MQIRFGWTLLRLSDVGDALLVTEPVFGRWPEEQWSPTIDESIEVLTRQVQLLHQLDIDGEDAYFDQFLVASPGAIKKSHIFLRRVDPIMPEDSGWLLGDAEDPEALGTETELERILLAKLVQQRPAVLQALALPIGSMVVFAGPEIERIYDAGGRERM